MNTRRIVIDGKTYTSVDEMPPDIRQKYEQAMSALKDNNQNNIPDGFENTNIFGDKNNNGIPDVFENMPMTSAVSKAMNFIVNGQIYNNLEDLPPEARAKYEKAMGDLDKNQNGVPDVLEGMMNMPNMATPNIQKAPAPASPFPVSSNPAPTPAPNTEPETSNNWMLVLAVVFLLGLCVLGGATIWYFFIR